MQGTNKVALLTEVAFNIGTLREAKKRFASKLAPEFSIFDYFRADEMALSSCIAGLLDPSGNHGQGSVFLRDFLEKLCPDVNWINRYESCVVKTEKQANGQRRIDVHLTFDEGVIGIENKPWAGDQRNQLSDYAKFLGDSASALKKSWLLVYLCNGEPSEESIPTKHRKDLERDKTFVSANYQKLIEWLELCRSKAEALNVRMFVEEVIRFVRINVNGEMEMSEENETCKTILSSKENLASAFQIYKSVDGVKRELMGKFKEKLTAKFDSLKFTLVWDRDLETYWKSYVGFGVKFEQSQNVYLRFEFASTGLNNFDWGLRREDEAVTKDPVVWRKIREVMESHQFGMGKESDWWPWYTQETNGGFPVDLRDWNKSELPWVMIMDDSDAGLVELIAKLACRVRDAFSADQSLLVGGLSTKTPVV